MTTKTKQELYINRPTSPHITIYRPQISSVLSILHRITGVGVFLGMSLIVWWFIFWVFSKFDHYYISFMQKGFFLFILVCISFTWFFHLCTGVRHLIWSLGLGFGIKCVNTSGWIAVLSACLLTVIFWIWII
jgi:succinate dehydrogenase / fumarate reductase cytochrome b subunit